MSEPFSLFAKVTIKPEKFKQFLSAKPEQPILNASWLDWWESREMYSKPSLTQESLQSYDAGSNQAIIDSFCNYKNFMSFSDYDETNETWHFGAMMYSENYLEMLPGLAFIKSVSKYNEAGSGDFALIYDYFWGDNSISAFLDLDQREVRLDPAIQSRENTDPQILEYSDNYLEAKLEEFKQSGFFADD